MSHIKLKFLNLAVFSVLCASADAAVSIASSESSLRGTACAEAKRFAKSKAPAGATPTGSGEAICDCEWVEEESEKFWYCEATFWYQPARRSAPYSSGTDFPATGTAPVVPQRGVYISPGFN